MKVIIPYIVGLNHLRTEQYLQIAAQHATSPITCAEMKLLHPLLKYRHSYCNVYPNNAAEGLEVRISREDDILAAIVRLSYGDNGIIPRVNDRFINIPRHFESSANSRTSHQYNPLSTIRDSYDFTYCLKHGWRTEIDDLAYSTLLSYGLLSNHTIAQQMPPLAMIHMRINFESPLPDKGIISIAHSIQQYERKGRECLYVSARLSSDEGLIASAEFDCCTAQDIIGEIRRID